MKWSIHVFKGVQFEKNMCSFLSVFSLVCFVAASPHCLDSLFFFWFFLKRDLLRNACAHQRNIFHSFLLLLWSIKYISIQVDHLVSCLWADRIYFSVSGVKVEDRSEFGDGGACREGFLRGNRLMMRIPCACSLRGLSVGSVVEYEESEQALNLTVTLKVLKQQSFKKCWVSSGPVLITWKQRDTRVKLEEGSKQISQLTVNM